MIYESLKIRETTTLTHGQFDLVCKWFELRFHKQPITDYNYFCEWVGRFESGHPETWMDSESLRVYNKLKE